MNYELFMITVCARVFLENGTFLFCTPQWEGEKNLSDFNF